MKTAQTAKGEITRNKIIRKAIEVFSKEGVAGASTQRIADQSGVSQTSLFHYFSNKSLLVEAMLGEILKSNLAVVSGAIHPKDDAFVRLLKYGEFNAMWALKRKSEAQIIILVYHLATFEPRFSEIYDSIRVGAQDKVLEYLLAGQREGIFHFTKDDNLKRVAETLHEALVGGIIHAVMEHDSQRALKNLKDKWGKLVRGVVHYSPRK